MVDFVLEMQVMLFGLWFEVENRRKNMKKQPTFQELKKLFKQNDYVEIGYITGIKRVYLS